MKALNWYRNNWYYVGGGIFVGLAIVMALFGELIDPVRRIMIVGYMGLLIHQFEEYVLPGVATMMLILIPVGAYYIWYVASHFSLEWWYYVAAGVLLLPVSFCSLMLPIKLLADKDSKYAWPQDECEKFHVMDKMKRIEPKE